MTIEERVTHLEAFAADVRDHTRILTEVIRRMDSRLDRHNDSIDRHEAWIDELHAAQANSEAKIAALADAQIHTEAALRNLTEKLDRLLEGRNGQT